MIHPKAINNRMNQQEIPGQDKKDRQTRWLYGIRIFFIFFIVIMIPILAKLVLRAGIPFYFIIGIISAKLVFEKLLLLNIHALVKKIIWIFSTIISILFAFTLLLIVIITPHSIYAFFFEIVKSGVLTEEYFVANLFVLLTIFFSLFFGSASVKQNSFKPLLGLVSLLFGLLLIIFQSFGIGFFLIVSLIIYLIVLLKKRALYFISIIILSSVMSIIFFNIRPEPEGSSFVDNFLYPQARKWIDAYIPEFPLTIDIPGYGMHHSSGTLGGSAILTSAPVFEVQADRMGVLYLQTEIYDTYVSNSWKHSPEFINDIIPESEGLPLSVFPESGRISVKILAEIYSRIPYTIDTKGFLYDNKYYKIPLSREIPGIILSHELRKNSVITLYRDPNQKGFSANLDHFLSFPTKLPESIKELAVLLGKNTSSDREILVNIKEFLATNYRYNLNISGMKKDEDFLEKFLFLDREGYCTHFATAFVILARLNGIPARYVNGYLVYVDDESFKKTVTARSAHAWPEIWLPDRGWHIWEPTQAVNIDYYYEYYEDIYDYFGGYMLHGNEIARNSLTLAQLRDLLGVDLEFAKEDKKDFQWWKTFFPLFSKVFLIIGIFIFACGILFIIRRLFMDHQSNRYWKVVVNRMVIYFKHIPPPEETGWINWKKNLCSHYDISKEEADELVGSILTFAYNNKLPGEKEMKLLKAYKQYKIAKI